MPEMIASRLVALQKQKVAFAPLLWVRCGCASVLYVPLHYVLRLDLTLPLFSLVLV